MQFPRSFLRPTFILVLLASCQAGPEPAQRQAPLSGTQTDVGSLPGGLQVLPSGDSGYSIPLQVPPGRAGLAPSLSLNYHSGRGNNWLGVGWGLGGGLSVIERCGKNHRDDGRVSSASKDANLCLDGQVLYPESKSEYRTRPDTQTSVVETEKGFSVRARNGIVHDYTDFGGFWLRIRSSDRSGNTVDYQIVDEEDKRKRIGAIRYNHVGETPHTSIRFAYEDRPDDLRGFDRGARSDMDKRLARIDVIWGDKLVRAYRLGYDDEVGEGSSTGRSRLNHVELCAGEVTDAAGNPIGDFQPSTCLPPTRFVYQDGDPGFQDGVDVDLPTPEKTFAQAVTPLDLNGDASDDILFVVDTPTGPHWAFAEADRTVSGGFGPVEISPLPAGEARSVQVLDLNNDRRDDLVYLRDATTIEVLEGDPAHGLRLAAFVHAQPGETIEVLTAIDFNGDGYRDIMTCEGPDSESLHWVWYQTSGKLTMNRVVLEQLCPSGPKVMLDVDQDGATDLVELGTTIQCPYIANDGPYETCPFNDVDALIADCSKNCGATPCFGSAQPLLTKKTCTLPGPTPQEGDCAIGEVPKIKECGYQVTLGTGHRLHTNKLTGPVSGSWNPRFQSFNNEADKDGFVLDSLGVSDFNGDGIADPAFIRRDLYSTDRTALVFLGTGAPNDYIEAEIPISELGPERSLVRFIDWDSDGRTDLLVADDTWKIILTSLDPDFEQLSTTVIDTGIPVHGQVMVGDYDGDGLADILTNDGLGLTVDGEPADTTDRWTLYLHNHLREAPARGLPDLLHKVTNGFGETTTINYQPLTDGVEWAESCDYPQRCDSPPRPVVASHSVEGHPATSYAYTEPRADMHGRRALGFARITSVQERGPGNQPITSWVEFDNSTLDSDRNAYVMAGLPTRQTTWVGTGALTDLHRVHQTTFDYTVKETASVDSPGADSTYFVYAQKTTEQTYELASAIDGPDINETPVRERILTTTRDNFGNLLTSHDQTSPLYFTLSETTYSNNPTDWLIGQPKRRTISSSAPAQVQSRVEDLFWTSEGLLERVVRSPDHAKHQQTTRFFYSEKGLVTDIQLTGDLGETVGQTITYDTDAGVYPVTVTNPLGQVSAQRWDYGQGLVTRSVNPENHGWNYDLDVFGRVVRGDFGIDGDFGPSDFGESGEGFTTVYERMDGGPAKSPSRLRVRQQPEGGIETYQEFDQHGRIEREGHKLTTNWSRRSYTYDHNGRLAGVSQPTWAPQQPTDWTDYQYDNHDRIRLVHRPDGGIVENEYSGLAMTATDAEGRAVRRVYDGLGRMVESVEGYGSMDASALCYRFGAFGQATAVIRGCVENNDTTTYIDTDAYGRRTAMRDPALGDWSYQHDGFDRLYRITDGNGDKVRFDYDDLGRQIQRYEEGTGAVQSWVWDTDYIGALYESRVLSGPTVRYESGGFGRLESITTLDGIDTLVESRNYDSFGRLSIVTMPSQTGLPPFRLQHSYSAEGQLAGVLNADTGDTYWELTGLDAAGRVIHDALGNGLETARGYDALGRPTSIVVAEPGDIGQLAVGSSAIFAETYSWDLSGNLKSRSEQVTGQSETFDYDAVNRLGHVTTNGKGSTIESWASFDKFGNFVSRTNAGTYSTTPGGRVLATNDRTYDHDGNGNVFHIGPNGPIDDYAGPGGTPTLPIDIEWNTRNKPVRITTPAGETQIIYTADGEVIRRNEPNRSVLRSGAYERVTTSNAVSDHYRIYTPTGLTAQVTREKELGLSLGEGGASGFVVETVQWVHGDHLNSARALSNISGKADQTMSYDAWGSPRSASDWLQSSTPEQTAIDLDYSGHRTGGPFVDMGGRQFDPSSATMLSADPIIPDPTSNQSLNRYMYVFGNPTSMTDPSGHAPAGWADSGIEDHGIVIGGAVELIDVLARPVKRGLARMFGADGNRGGNSENRGTKSTAVSSELSVSGGVLTPTEVSWTDNVAQGLAGLGDFWLETTTSNAKMFMCLPCAAYDGYQLYSSLPTSPHAALDSVADALPLLDAFRAIDAGNAKDWRGFTFSTARAIYKTAMFVTSWRRPGECFAAGTPVQAEAGLVPIEEVRVGDLVWARDDTSGEIALRAVTSLFVTPNQQLYDVVVSAADGSEDTLQVTSGHPFWVRNRGWVDSELLVPGDQVFTLASGWLRVSGSTATQTSATVYNFSVDEFQTYFVGKFGTWVHNSPACGGKYGALLGHGGEVHHVISSAALRRTGLETRYSGPSLRMSKADHARTASHPSFKPGPGQLTHRQYIDRQVRLIEQGRIRQVIDEDVAHIRKAFPGRYERGIREMLEYAESRGWK